jgi:hypothetical protein
MLHKKLFQKNKSMSKQEQREFKIGGLYRRSIRRNVPQLKLSGAWIETLGFEVGDMVSVMMRDRLLIIVPLEQSEPEQDYKAALKELKETLKHLVK